MSESNTKTCHACKKKVPTETKGECPLCGKAEGYETSVTIVENVKISDEVHRTLEWITEIKTPNKKHERISLLIFTVSIIVASLIPTDPFFKPLAILIAVFLSAIPLGYTSYHTERTHLIDRD